MSAATEHAHAVIRRHSKSFSLAVRFLPERARADAVVIYAWCRHADDAIDDSRGAAQLHALSRLRAELVRVRDPQASLEGESGALSALCDVVVRNQIPLEYPSELLDGMEMDVLGQSYESLEQLLLYCHRVASTVGLMMCHVLGARHPDALRHAAHLGLAMQLTNICRDVREDWDRGRLYLPRELLLRHGASQHHSILPSPNTASRPFPRALVAPCRGVVRELLAVADGYYASGDRGLRYLPWRAALAVNLARRVYSGIGAELARTGYDVTAPRAVVPPLRKLALLVRAIASTLAGGRAYVDAQPLQTVKYGADTALF